MSKCETNDNIGRLEQITQHLAKFLQQFGLRDQPDVVREIGDTYCELCTSRIASGIAYSEMLLAMQ